MYPPMWHADRVLSTCDAFLFSFFFIHFLYLFIQKAMILWTMDPAERDANLVHEAVKKKKKDESYVSVLVEVSCASTPDHLMAVRNIYRKLFSSSVEEDVASSPALQEPLKKVREIVRGNAESSVQALVSFALHAGHVQKCSEFRRVLHLHYRCCSVL